MEESVATRKPHQVELLVAFEHFIDDVSIHLDAGGSFFSFFFSCARSRRLKTQYHGRTFFFVLVKYGPPKKGKRKKKKTKQKRWRNF